MKTKTKIIISVSVLTSIVLVIGGVLLIGHFAKNFVANTIKPGQEHAAIMMALSWGGLAELPEEAENISVIAKGSIFSAVYVVEFNCSESAIDRWISESKGSEEPISRT